MAFDGLSEEEKRRIEEEEKRRIEAEERYREEVRRRILGDNLNASGGPPPLPNNNQTAERMAARLGQSEEDKRRIEEEEKPKIQEARYREEVRRRMDITPPPVPSKQVVERIAERPKVPRRMKPLIRAVLTVLTVVGLMILLGSVCYQKAEAFLIPRGGLGHYLNHQEAMEDAHNPFYCEALAEEINQIYPTTEEGAAKAAKYVGDRANRAEGHYNAWRGYCYLVTVTHDHVRLLRAGEVLVAEVKLPERLEGPLGQILDLAQAAQSGNLLGLARGLDKILKATTTSCYAPQTTDCEAAKRFVKFELSH